jgi:probable HAF family extracellular repeat protein
MVDLGTLGGPYSSALAVNAVGQVVGWSRTTQGAYDAFSWTPGGGMVDLGTLGADSRAVAVNDSGEVVGSGYTADNARHAFSWTTSAGMVDLGTLGGYNAEALALNDSGQVVGRSTTSAGATHAVLWTPLTPFASLDASAVVAVPPGAGNDTFVLNAAFTLGSTSNGIDPATEPVTLALAGATLTVPPGSFSHNPGSYVYTGKLGGGRLVVTIRPAGAGSYRLTATGSGYDLPAARLPLSVQLTIGDDTGTTDAKAVIAPPPAR